MVKNIPSLGTLTQIDEEMECYCHADITDIFIVCSGETAQWLFMTSFQLLNQLSENCVRFLRIRKCSCAKNVLATIINSSNFNK